MHSSLCALVRAGNATGSSYMVGPTAFLTAKHVVTDGRSQLQSTVRVKLYDRVHDISQLSLDQWLLRTKPRDPLAKWIDVDVLLPRYEDLDVAILRPTEDDDLKACAGLWKEHEHNVFLSDTLDTSCEAHILGYPHFTRTWIGRKSLARLRPFLASIPQYMEDNDLPTIQISEDETPSSPKGWETFSGAPIFHDGCIVGVISQAAVGTANNRILHYTPSFFILQDDDIGPALPTKKYVQGGAPALSKMNALLDQLDKRDAVDDFARRYSSVMSGREENSPVAFTLYGHRYDDLDAVIRRVTAEVLCDRYYDTVAGGRTHNPFCAAASSNLGTPGFGVEHRFRTLLCDWTRSIVFDLPPSDRLDTERLRVRLLKRLTEDDAPRLHIISHPHKEFTFECAEVVRELMRLLRSIAPITPPHHIFLKVQTGYEAVGMPFPRERVDYPFKRDQLSDMLFPTIEKQALHFHLHSSAPEMAPSGSDFSCFIHANCYEYHIEEWLEYYFTETSLQPKPSPQFSELLSSFLPIKSAKEALLSLDWETSSK